MLAIGWWLVGAALGADLDAWVRPGCPHCADAEVFLDELAARRPGLEVAWHDVTAAPEALAELERVSAAHGVTTPGVPSFLVGDELVVGYSTADTTGAALEALLEAEGTWGAPGGAAPAGTAPGGSPADATCAPEAPCAPVAPVILPGVGAVDVDRLGLPAFTVLIGLLDGLNPCATWVLLFLLSVLVRVRDRARVVAVAGTFVVVSGLVYFAFMSAWLSVFAVLGVARWVQVALGVLAVVIGGVNLRDAVAGEGAYTLSIPERFKPLIMDRSRSVSRAASLGAAVVGAAGLAVLVNLVELLCTAGLPAVYTAVLARHELSPAARLGYLALYDVAYMLDDAALVAVAVVTLSRTRLQERGGRALKLVAGALMAALGGVLLLRPEWLAFG